MFARILDRLERQSQRMSRMMQRLNVDVVELATSRRGRDFASARAACVGCRNTAACEASLDAWQAGRPGAAQPDDFCPNARLFSQHRCRP